MGNAEWAEPTSIDMHARINVKDERKGWKDGIEDCIRREESLCPVAGVSMRRVEGMCKDGAV